ncbi:G-protein coupled receptor GRL101-like [Mercenaria mercenaria]|uniref:G-protein coupled receptor GRL101-like n=1 Tax=Mercenaria mercenaria TaxID=6596 RepID=UPI00234EDB1C|nr:G-protein coupled receptor GRL101-like [Mercenaria mercenaria]
MKSEASVTIMEGLSLDTDYREDRLFEERDRVTMFHCTSGEWTSSRAQCNGIVECVDASDEMYCSSQGEKCSQAEFTCPDGRCVHISQVCDFVNDCVDGADEFCEFPSCSNEQFTCSNGQCISSSERCDSVKNCLDGSDEINCVKCNSSTAFKCGDRLCISKRLVCDMHVDCPDGADEMSCDHTYSTCHDLYNDGYTQNGYYEIGEEQTYTIYCDFDNYRQNSVMKMTLLNTDWQQVSENKFGIETVGISKVVYNSRYDICTQKFSMIPHRERLDAMQLDNKTVPSEDVELSYDEILSATTTVKYQGSFQLEKIPFSNADSSNFDNFYLATLKSFNSFENRVKIGHVECRGNSSLSDTEKFRSPPLFCRYGVRPVNESKRCLYNKDHNGITDGCRSLAHLQNCKNFDCPQDYMKCPGSFCIPLMYVCNGKIDCPDGYDEKICGCEPIQNKIIIMLPWQSVGSSEDSKKLYEMSTRLGGLLFSDKNTVQILGVDYHNQEIEPEVIMESTDVLSHSELFNKAYKRYHLISYENKTFFEDMFNGTYKQFGIIWLSNSAEHTDSEHFIFSELERIENNSSNVFMKYRLEIDKNLRTEILVNAKTSFKQIKVRNSEILGTIGAQLFPEVCTEKMLSCKGRYRCISSKVCIPFKQLCDSRKQCPHGDDEHHCDFKCPANCSCGPLVIDCSNIEEANVNFSASSPTRVLDISNSTLICKDLLENADTRRMFSLLIFLNISRCDISFLSNSSFTYLSNLRVLDITFNKFRKLPKNAFNDLKALRYLNIHGNRQLKELEPGAFNGILINSLTLSYTSIRTLSTNSFKGLHLSHLDLSYSNILSVNDMAFNHLTTDSIDIRGNPIKEFTKNMFAGVTGVKKLKTPAFKYCCIRPYSVAEDDCLPHKDEFSSCADLMRNSTLQALMWVIGILALIGNIISLVYRLLYDRKRLKLGYGIFVTNLALADLLMGVYMLIIAIADKIFRNRYIEVDDYWRNSAWCQLAGVLSTVSSEASVLFMCLITIDRILVIKYPFGHVRITVKSAICAVSATWLFVFIISLVPVFYTDYFEGKFYSKSGVCLALPLTRDRPPGWLYSILLFIGFNMITFILIAVGQLLIYAEIKKHTSMQKSLNVTRTNDLKVARNLLLVVTTDFLCWFPIGTMGILALSGHTIPGEVYAWTAVFVLPINSALNPFMYTLTAIYNRQNFNPSVDEQSRTALNTEMGMAILKLYPYIPTHKQKRKCKTVSLHDLTKDRNLTKQEILHLTRRIVKFLEVIHDSDLVLGRLTENDIFISLSNNGHIQRKIQIDVKRHLELASKKSSPAGDICHFGGLIDRVLKKTTTHTDGRLNDETAAIDEQSLTEPITQDTGV